MFLLLHIVAIIIKNNMTISEKDALIKYLEFNIIALVERYEQNIYNVDIIASLYTDAYNLVKDVENSILTKD